MPRFDHRHVPDPDLLSAPVVGLIIDAPGPHDSGLHSHHRSQLLYASSGVMQISIGDTHFLLPPTAAAWIPSGLPHRVQARKPFAYRSLYIHARRAHTLPAGPRVLSVSPLLRELIVDIADWPLHGTLSGQQRRLFRVLLDCLQTAPEQALRLTMPEDQRLRRIAERLIADPRLAWNVAALTEQCGLSQRAASRLFHSQTGMALGAWCQQLRLLAARRLLAEDVSVAEVSDLLGYAQESTFIAMFRRCTGAPPGRSRSGWSE